VRPLPVPARVQQIGKKEPLLLVKESVDRTGQRVIEHYAYVAARVRQLPPN
jgi:hypothetical protein